MHRKGQMLSFLLSPVGHTVTTLNGTHSNHLKRLQNMKKIISLITFSFACLAPCDSFMYLSE